MARVNLRALVELTMVGAWGMAVASGGDVLTLSAGPSLCQGGGRRARSGQTLPAHWFPADPRTPGRAVPGIVRRAGTDPPSATGTPTP